VNLPHDTLLSYARQYDRQHRNANIIVSVTEYYPAPRYTRGRFQDFNQGRAMNWHVIAAVDIGSNTIKLTVANVTSEGNIEELASAAETVRLGLGMNVSGRLASDRIDAALAALRHFAGIARQHNATRLIGVATEATRKAANGAAFLDRVRSETGWDVTVIDGDREAALTFRGISRNRDLTGTVLIADVGGGSTELIEAQDGAVVRARSVPIGSGTLTDSYITADPPTATELDACAHSVTAQLESTPLPTSASLRLIAVGGTAEFMAALVGRNTDMSIEEMERSLVDCQDMPSSLLAATLGIAVARARVLPAGIAVLLTLARHLGVPAIDIAPSGIRTGLILETLADLT
jgi:exopolyphosphatase/guanosine-5'-triphosphate,3'-diphosphate pyrophosphatase